MNYYSHHIGDYLSATAHLTLLEHGVYRRMIDVYYINEAPLPCDRKQVCRLVGARTKEEKDAVDSILSEFFEETTEGWRQSRCDHEIGLCNKNRNNGKKGGRPSKNDNPNKTQTKPKQNPNANPNVTQPESPPSPHHPSKPPIPPDGGFDRFWAAYPKKVGKGAAEKAFSKAPINGHLPDVLTALERQKQSDQWHRDGGQFIPNPATWLNQRRWEDGDAQPAKADWI